MNKGSLCPWKGKYNTWEVRGAVGQTWKSMGKTMNAVRAATLAEMIRGAWAGNRRGLWQTWCGETCSGYQSKQRSTGLKGPHMAPNYTWINSSLCFQVLASTNITRLELGEQQKFLQYSPHPLWGTEYFPSLEEQPRRAAYLNKVVQMPGTRMLRGRTPAHCLNSACTAHSSSCLTVPLSVLHTDFASCLASTADPAKQR